MGAPRVGVAPDIDAGGERSVESGYLDAIRAAGGEPQPLGSDAPHGLSGVHALLLCGGAFDIPPEWYGQSPRVRVDPPRLARSQLERALLSRAEALELPVLGICGGAQLMAVHRGGSLVQDIAACCPGALDHERGSESGRAVHPVELAPESQLARWVGATRLQVNSTHHQSVERPGREAVAVGWAPDGVIEAIEDPRHTCWVGVQWHPEKLDDRASRSIWAGFVEAARGRAEVG